MRLAASFQSVFFIASANRLTVSFAFTQPVLVFPVRKALTHARLVRARVVLVAPSPFVAEVLETTNLNIWFEICADMEGAARLLSEE